MKNHLPIRPAPVMASGTAGDAALQQPLPDELLLPEGTGGSFPLVVCVTDGSIPAEAGYFLQMGWAVLTCFADRRMEQDPAALAAWQEAFHRKLDTVLAEHPQPDPGKLFLVGWTAAAVVFHSRRFRAAAQLPALLDRAAAWGTCPAGWVEPGGMALKELLEKLEAGSVLMDADSCRTPMLVLHNAEEKRYAPEQSEILYSVLKDRVPNIPSRLAVFPAGARPERISREIADWFRRFLQEDMP